MHRLTHVVKFLRYSIIIFSFTIFTRCSSDDPAPADTAKPEVEFVQASRKNFAGETNLTFNVVDDQQIAVMKIFIDGNLFQQAEFEADQVSYTVKWDTKVVREGQHQLKVIVADHAGNASESTFQINVRNILAKYTVEGAYLQANQKYFVFASDAEGEVLDVREVKNNTTTILYCPADFDGDTFSLTEFRQLEVGAEVLQHLDSYFDIATRTVTLKGTGATVIHNVPLSISDVPEGQTGQFNGVNILENHAIGSGSLLTGTLRFTTEQSDLFVVLTNFTNENRYRYLEDVTPDDDFTFSSDDFEDYNVTTLSTPGGSKYNNFQVGYRQVDGKTSTYFMGVNAGSEGIQVLNTEQDIFNAYFTLISFEVDNVRYSMSGLGELPTTISKLGTTITDNTFNFGNLELSLDDDVTFAAISGTREFKLGEILYKVYRKVVVPGAAEINVTVPKIPGALADYFTEVDFTMIDFTTVELADLESVDSYQDYVNGVAAPGSYVDLRKTIVVSE